MTFTIAVAGKGGVGKTSISALIMKYLIEEKQGLVLAVDADPNYNLNEKIGVESVKTIGSLREDLIKESDKIPSGISKTEHLQYLIRTLIEEGNKFDILVMGRPEGPGCYCYINNVLRSLIDSLSEKYQYVVIDNEAGMEHLSRRTTRNINLLIVVSDGSMMGVKTAIRIRRLSQEMNLKIGKTLLLVNRCCSAVKPNLKFDKGELNCFDEIHYISDDDKLNNYNSESKSLFKLPQDTIAYCDMKKLMDGTLK